MSAPQAVQTEDYFREANAWMRRSNEALEKSERRAWGVSWVMGGIAAVSVVAAGWFGAQYARASATVVPILVGEDYIRVVQPLGDAKLPILRSHLNSFVWEYVRCQEDYDIDLFRLRRAKCRAMTDDGKWDGHIDRRFTEDNPAGLYKMYGEDAIVEVEFPEGFLSIDYIGKNVARVAFQVAVTRSGKRAEPAKKVAIVKFEQGPVPRDAFVQWATPTGLKVVSYDSTFVVEGEK